MPARWGRRRTSSFRHPGVRRPGHERPLGIVDTLLRRHREPSLPPACLPVRGPRASAPHPAEQIARSHRRRPDPAAVSRPPEGTTPRTRNRRLRSHHRRRPPDKARPAGSRGPPASASPGERRPASRSDPPAPRPTRGRQVSRPAPALAAPPGARPGRDLQGTGFPARPRGAGSATRQERPVRQGVRRPSRTTRPRPRAPQGPIR